MALLVTDNVDFLLGPDNDLVITNGQLQFATGVAGVAQLISIACQMVRGEWFLDLNRGIPLLQNATVTAAQAIAGQQPNIAKARAAYKAVILGVNGTDPASLVINLSYDGPTRALSVNWTVGTIFGDTVTGSLVTGGTV